MCKLQEKFVKYLLDLVLMHLQSFSANLFHTLSSARCRRHCSWLVMNGETKRMPCILGRHQELLIETEMSLRKFFVVLLISKQRAAKICLVHNERKVKMITHVHCYFLFIYFLFLFFLFEEHIVTALYVCPSVRLSARVACLEHNRKTILDDLFKLNTVVEPGEEECSSQEP